MEKIVQARRIIEERNYRCVIEVDGGIAYPDGARSSQGGAEVLVAGSAIFQAPDPARKIKELLEIAASVGYHQRQL